MNFRNCLNLDRIVCEELGLNLPPADLSVWAKLVTALEDGLESLDGAWLARIESAQRANPRNATLQYLAGMACMKRQLWGKAQQLLTQAAMGLQDLKLHRKAWRALARLAEERGDPEAAQLAYQRAADG